MDRNTLEEQDISRLDHIHPAVTHLELILPGHQARTRPLRHTCHQDSAPLECTLHQQEHTRHRVLTHQRLIQVVYRLDLDILPVQVTIPLW